jgi:hypothetical protein
MAIQIDLLPQYVGLRRKVKMAAIFMTFVYAIAGTAFTLVWYSKTLEVQTAKANVATYQPVADEATRVKGEADKKLSSLTPINDTVKFFADATQTGPRRAAVIDMMRLYFTKDSQVSSIDISDGQKVLITASIEDTEHYANLLLNLRKGWGGYTPQPATPIIFKGDTGNVPKASGVLGFPKVDTPSNPPVRFGEQVPRSFPITVNIQTALTDDLKFETPTAPGEAAAGAAAAPGGSGSGAPATN